jgi:hypothetical protein
MEIFMTWAQFAEYSEAKRLIKKRFTETNRALDAMFFIILLLEDLPQLAVVVGYRAYSPKEPGTYDYYLAIVTFASSILSIFSKTTTTAWGAYKGNEENFLSPVHFMLLYTLPLVGVFVAAFLNPTNADLTYTALAMALSPQVFFFGILLLLCCSDCSDSFKKVKKIAYGLSEIYSKIMQPNK